MKNEISEDVVTATTPTAIPVAGELRVVRPVAKPKQPRRKALSDPREISDQFDRWNDALRSGDPKKVVACYAEDAVLLPTFSTQVCRSHDEIQAYFVGFLAKNPAGRMVQQNIRVLGPVAVNSGHYTFSVEENGRRTDVAARFTFVYRKDTQGWRIIEHHSSLLPA